MLRTLFKTNFTVLLNIVRDFCCACDLGETCHDSDEVTYFIVTIESREQDID